MSLFKEIITANSGTSSKRLISLVSLLLFVITVFAGLCGVLLPDVYIISIVSLVGLNQGLTLFQRGNKTQNNELTELPDERF